AVAEPSLGREAADAERSDAYDADRGAHELSPVAVAGDAGKVATISSAELMRRLLDSDATRSARSATEDILVAWRDRPLTADEARRPGGLEPIAWRRGLQHVTLPADRRVLRQLDLPAVIALRFPDVSAPRSATVIGMDASRVVLSVGGEA